MEHPNKSAFIKGVYGTRFKSVTGRTYIIKGFAYVKASGEKYFLVRETGRYVVTDGITLLFSSEDLLTPLNKELYPDSTEDWMYRLVEDKDREDEFDYEDGETVLLAAAQGN